MKLVKVTIEIEIEQSKADSLIRSIQRESRKITTTISPVEVGPRLRARSQFESRIIT